MAISGVRLTRLPCCMREGTEKKGKYEKFPKPRLQRLYYLNDDPQVKQLSLMPPLRKIEEVGR